MARAFAPAVTLSVSGIAPEAPTIIVSPVYASPQACMIRIIAFVLVGPRLLRGNRRSKTVGGKRPLLGSRDLADLGRAGGCGVRYLRLWVVGIALPLRCHGPLLSGSSRVAVQTSAMAMALTVDCLRNRPQRPPVEPREVDPLAHGRSEPISRVTAELTRLGLPAGHLARQRPRLCLKPVGQRLHQ